ncbi:S4 domain-containing protein YaaA [Merdibacter massiliensis]|uniref:S4 domain-containing protein YaaA n=1 Tax=Merdibacter massiliensis TaxID=1871030 RepID=UPI00096A444B|nr:S4 domain-containing protein YaaA [Merdibacter massiliensis]
MEFKVKNEFITLGQLLKACDFISSGAQAKFAVKELDIKVNDEKEDRRGRKLYSGDVVVIDGSEIRLK